MEPKTSDLEHRPHLVHAPHDRAQATGPGVEMHQAKILDMEEQLAREKKKYQDLFNLSPLPQFIYDLDSLKFLDVNQAAIAFYGYSKAEFLQMKISEIRPLEDVEAFQEIVQKKVKIGQFNDSKVRHKTKSGEIMHVHVRGNSVSYDHINARLAIVVDHSDKINAQNALEVSEQRFRSLVQEGSDLIAIIDPEGYYHYVNPNSKAILGIDSHFFIGRNVSEFIHQEDQQMVNDQLGRLSVEKRVAIPPFRFNVGKERYRWIETVVTNMLEEPTINGIIANSRDVTERIAAEHKIQQSIERYNVVSKATSDAIWDRDILTGKVIWNKGIKGIFGYNETSSTQDWWLQRMHPDDVCRIVKKMDSLIKNKGSRLEVEYRFRCKDGSYKNVLDRSFLMFDIAGDPIRMIGSVQDITEMKKSFQAIQEQNLRLKDISWIQSHSVRAPVARIKSLTSLLAGGNMDEPSVAECLKYLISSANELDSIICDIIRKTEGRER
jgi:PAS domain S-box-containing protein